jgi:hypothetical protein
MNLILNREINGYHLKKEVKILAAMNPSSKYGEEFDYQVVDMDAAQENRFVWLFMEPDHMQWLGWAIEEELDSKVISFIATFPEYLHKKNDDTISATPRSYERISKTIKVYLENQNSIPRSIFFQVLKGNVGKVIAEEFISFMEADYAPLISYEDIFEIDALSLNITKQIEEESHTRLYLSAKNVLKKLESNITNRLIDSECSILRLIELLKLYPIDLRIALMKDMRANYHNTYEQAMENEAFVELYFDANASLRG